jgi:hypothetical protein
VAGRSPPARPRRLVRSCANPHRASLRLVDLEGAGVADEIAQLAISVGARIEIRSDVGKALPYDTEADPAILCLDLLNRSREQWNRSASGLKGPARAAVLFRRGHCRLRQQVFGVYEATAGLPEAFRRLLCAKSVDIGTFLAKSGGHTSIPSMSLLRLLIARIYGLGELALGRNGRSVFFSMSLAEQPSAYVSKAPNRRPYRCQVLRTKILGLIADANIVPKKKRASLTSQ